MNFKRLSTPELATNLEGSPLSRGVRELGGLALGLFGYSAGVLSIAGVGATGGLSLPVLGALSAASFAGSRALMRPAYQNDPEYSAVKSEETSQKLGRYAVFGLGFVGLNVGINLLTGGLFNAFPQSIGAGFRIASVVGGLIAMDYSAKAIQGSFDPKLYSEEPVSTENTTRSLATIARESFVNSYRRTRSQAAAA